MADMVWMACGKCGIEFTVPSWFDAEKRKTGDDWYCPNGHCRVYSESEADKYRRLYQNQKQQNAMLKDDVETEKHRASAYLGQITKMKKRASAGVCPCCNRSFQNLKRHMTSKHPDYADNVVPIAS